MTDVKIRVATEADAPALARFRYELRSSKCQMIESDAEFIERCTAWMRKRLRDDSSWQCWIAECDQTPCGNVWAQLVEKIPNPAAETECYVYLTNFYVREEYRGEGIGTQLLSELLAWSKAKNAHTIILWPRERSKTLYARYGFAAADDLMRLSLDRD
jgi:GNAT superfamily N-acetyltransferase